MFCSECGKAASGKFCSNCGTPLASQPNATVAVAEPVGRWEAEVRYEALVRVPEVRAAIDRQAALAQKGITGEEFLKLAAVVVPTGLPKGLPVDKLANLVQPLYARWGIGTGKQREKTIDVPIGRAMMRVLCSLARRGRPLRGVKQAEDGCFFEAAIPPDFRSFEGDFLITVRRHDSRTEVSASANIKGQLYDWGKSRECLDQFFADLQLDPA